jgi:hypothetical protein
MQIRYLAIVHWSYDDLSVVELKNNGEKEVSVFDSSQKANDWIDNNFYQLHEKYNSPCGDYCGYIRKH